MNAEEREKIERAASVLNGTVQEVRARERYVQDARRLHETSLANLKLAADALLKLVHVGSNARMKSVRIPETQSSLVVQWHPGEQLNSGKPRVSIHLAHPGGAEEVL